MMLQILRGDILHDIWLLQTFVIFMSWKKLSDPVFWKQPYFFHGTPHIGSNFTLSWWFIKPQTQKARESVIFILHTSFRNVQTCFLSSSALIHICIPLVIFYCRALISSELGNLVEHITSDTGVIKYIDTYNLYPTPTPLLSISHSSSYPV